LKLPGRVKEMALGEPIIAPSAWEPARSALDQLRAARSEPALAGLSTNNAHGVLKLSWAFMVET
jgi:hypothetical protein